MTSFGQVMGHAALRVFHARDRKVAACLQQTAEAFEEIGEIDLANDWAK